MNLKILMLILLYYMSLSIIILLPESPFSKDFDIAIDLNSSEMSSEEIDKGGLFNTGVSFTRFTGLITTGIGLPVDTPQWFKFMFASWQIVFLIFSVGFVISSIWNG